MPWAEEPAISFLTTPDTVQNVLEAMGFRILEWEDKSHQSLEWYRSVVETLQRSGPLPLGMHLLMGHTTKAKFENNICNLQEGWIVVFQAVAEKA